MTTTTIPCSLGWTGLVSHFSGILLFLLFLFLFYVPILLYVLYISLTRVLLPLQLCLHFSTKQLLLLRV
jgi:hypothetical protein